MARIQMASYGLVQNKRQMFKKCKLFCIFYSMKLAVHKEDLRIRRTKESIYTAFKQMVCEMPYEKITVKALADRAMINRNTFYLHYESTDDVLREIQAGYMERYIELVKDYNYLDNQKEIVRSFFEFMESQDEFFKKITCDSRLDYVREPMQRKVLAHTHSKTTRLHTKQVCIQNIVRAFNNTTLALYRQWVQDGRKIPLKQMIDLAATLMEGGIKAFANRE